MRRHVSLTISTGSVLLHEGQYRGGVCGNDITSSGAKSQGEARETDRSLTLLRLAFNTSFFRERPELPLRIRGSLRNAETKDVAGERGEITCSSVSCQEFKKVCSQMGSLERYASRREVLNGVEFTCGDESAL